jgi:hypothetical protein
MGQVQIYFEKCNRFEPFYIRPLSGIVGLYFIALTSGDIMYPFNRSRLLYIGMSEKKTNSIGSRLQGHYDGQSGNAGLFNYRSVQPLEFTFINFEMVKSMWPHRIEDLESYFILDFVAKFGVYPICNNKTGFEIQQKEVDVEFQIDWKHFGGG